MQAWWYSARMAFKPRLAERIRREIKARGLTGYRVAKDTGISEPAVGRFLNGKSLTLENAERVLEYLDVEIVFPAATKKKG